MAKRKPKPPEQPKVAAETLESTKATPKRTGLSLHVYLPPVLRKALDEAADRNRRKITGEVIVAIEKHLRELGLLGEESD